jgi:HD-GYP domain-containing protein (c-di-GMP phosphodiesterase class II)
VGVSSKEIDSFNRAGGIHPGLGMTGWTAANRAPTIVDDVEASEHWVQIPGLDDGVRSAISVPLLVGDDLVGVLNLLSDKVSAFHDEHFAVLQAAAAPVAVALQSADLFAETHQRLVELETINKVSTSLRAAQTLDEMLPLLLDATLEMVHTNRGAIWLYDNAKNELRPEITRGWNPELPIPPEKPGEGIAGIVFASGQTLISSEFQQDLRIPEATRQRIPPGIGGASIPIRAGENVIGVFMISMALPRELTPSEIQLLTTVSEMAGNAIQRTMLHEQTERRLQHLSALSVIDRAITSSFDLRFSLTTLLNQTIAELGVDAADVLLFNPGLQNLEFIAGSGFRTPAFEHAQLRLGEGYAGRAALDRIVFHVDNLAEQRDNPRLLKHLAEEQFVSYYGVPLIAKGQVKGVLEIFQRSQLAPDTEWLNFLKALAEQAAIAVDNASLFNSLQRTNTELRMAYDATIEGWSRALDLRDKETQGHTQRVMDMTVKLARAFALSDEELVHIRRGALLHDIGKMGVPDQILLKPGPLSDEEWLTMKKHPVFAYEMLSPIHYLRSALDIPYCHHEKWDGTGYPRGLKGEQIPLVARIFSVVDVWDALNSNRSYRLAWPEQRVREYIRAQAGNSFEPKVVKMCMESGILVTPKTE